MHERRRDPRTSKPFSLQNLLRLRAQTDGILLAVVGTPDGLLMGSSRDGSDRQATRLVAHASSELFRGSGRSTFALEAPNMPGLRLLGTRLQADGRTAFVAAIVRADRPFSLDDLGACVARILNEPARTREKVAA